MLSVYVLCTLSFIPGTPRRGLTEQELTNDHEQGDKPWLVGGRWDGDGMTTGFHFPIPTDATRVGDWQLDKRGSFVRMFDGTQRGSGDLRVGIIGVQGIDGVIRGRWIFHGDLNFDSAEARDMASFCYTVAEVDAVDDPEMAEEACSVAEKLLAAADELDCLSVGGGNMGR